MNDMPPRTRTCKGSTHRGLAPLLLFFIGILLCIGLCLLPLWPRFVIENARTQRVLRVMPIEDGETFQLRFTHSLNLSDVTDTIEWTGQELICRSTLFTTYGAGIPDLPDGIGKSFSVTKDGFVLSGIDKPEKEIRVLLQTVPNHRLTYRNQTVSLLDLYGSGTLLSLCVHRVSLLDRILYERTWR